MINQRDRNEKITKMKLQTARVLWQEGRKDATFLLIESIDDPRGDSLRDRMGFSDDYEVSVSVQSRGFSNRQVGLVVVLTAIIFWTIGFLLSPDHSNQSIVEATLNEEQVVSSLIAPTPAPGETLAQPLVALTATAHSGQPTVDAVETQQSNMQANISLSSTARYDQATATENARATQAATGNQS